ncbi:hypothetical protein AVEN_5420-1 [Araneus ventricosus]|uniref:Uncharacterized protein n=1 Tax=Araneus ventricosus TaxID=182803 RepID=A0A4Y2M1F7_ARAVE|nr:hypothetical protein AVEN_5420-1 [Araneus ventricosus]
MGESPIVLESHIAVHRLLDQLLIQKCWNQISQFIDCWTSCSFKSAGITYHSSSIAGPAAHSKVLESHITVHRLLVQLLIQKCWHILLPKYSLTPVRHALWIYKVISVNAEVPLPFTTSARRWGRGSPPLPLIEYCDVSDLNFYMIPIHLRVL